MAVDLRGAGANDRLSRTARCKGDTRARRKGGIPPNGLAREARSEIQSHAPVHIPLILDKLGGFAILGAQKSGALKSDSLGKRAILREQIDGMGHVAAMVGP